MSKQPKQAAAGSKRRGRPPGSKTTTNPLVTVFPPTCMACGHSLTAESAPARYSERVDGPIRLKDGKLYRYCQKQIRMCGKCGQRNDVLEARDVIPENG